MIPIAKPILGREELENVIKAVKSGWISSKGKFIEEFEYKFANYCNTIYGISTPNGTTSLHLALRALDIKKGDEVIVPDLTFISPVDAVKYCNAIPILVDAHSEYWCIDPDKIEEKITPKTKAIIPVHLYGHSCNMYQILDIAEDHDLFVVEDVAEAHGGEYMKKKLGSFGDISCFSFFANKVITTGEGGMCITNNEELWNRMKLLRLHGMNEDKRYWHQFIGYNYNMTNMQAAIGVAQIKKIDHFIKKRRQIGKWYNEGFKELAEQEVITLQPEMEWTKCIYWMYCILLRDYFDKDRDKVMNKLERKGVETRPFFYPVHMFPHYKQDGFEVAENIALRGINLPSYPSLTIDDIDFIIQKVKEVIAC